MVLSTVGCLDITTFPDITVETKRNLGEGTKKSSFSPPLNTWLLVTVSSPADSEAVAVEASVLFAVTKELGITLFPLKIVQ